MSRRRFERLVAMAVRDLPAAIRARLDNVAITVEEWPDPEVLAEQDIDDAHGLFGLYQGTPLIDRTSDYGFTLPDKITIYQGPLEDAFKSDYAIRSEVAATVVHELAHHFGMTDEDLLRIGAY